MSEDKIVAKRSLTRRFFAMGLLILRWFLVSVFAIFFIVALIFHAPVKVLALFLIFALCTAIFRWKIQIVFWSVVSLLIVALFVWLHMPESNHAWHPYFFKDRVAAFSDARVIDDDANAAIIYDRLLQQHSYFNPSLLNPAIHGLSLTEPWSSTDYPDLAMVLRSNGQIIDTLLEAVSFADCRFPVAARVSAMEAQMRRSAYMKCYGRILLNSANNDIGNGDTEQAFEKQIAALRVAHHSLQQQTLFDTTAGNAIETMALYHLNHFIMDCSPTEEQLARLEKQIAAYPANDLASDWPAIYESLRLLSTNITGLLFETNYDKDIRRSHIIPQIINSRLNIHYRLTLWEKRLCRGGALIHWFTLPADPPKCAAIVDRSFDKYAKLIDPGAPPEEIAETSRPPIRLNFKSASDIVAHYCASFYLPLYSQSLRRENSHRSTSILIALKRYHIRHKSYPKSLEELAALSPEIFIDPLNGLPFAYRLTPDGFMLYSIGKNAIDDNGVSDMFKEIDDIIYWPPPYKLTQKSTSPLVDS